MEYVEGETLAQLVRGAEAHNDRKEEAALRKDAKTLRRDAKDEEARSFRRPTVARDFLDLAEAFAGVADGLQHAHSKGVVHRDIKPSNLIFDADGRLRILDFGLARLEGQESLTLTGDFVGTPAYVSPEQARRQKVPVDYRTDIYSLGATLYEVLTGQPPFRGSDHNDTLTQIIERDPRRPRQWNDRVPEDLQTIALKCLRKEPGDRYGTAEALGQDLRRFARGDSIEARPQLRVERLARLAWNARLGIAVGLGCLVLLCVVGLLAQSEYNRRRLQDKARYRDLVNSAVGAIQLGLLGEPLLESSDSHKYKQILYLLGQAPGVEEGATEAGARRALQQLEEAIALFPKDPDAHYHLARGLWFLHLEDEALQRLHRTLELDRDFVPARTFRAMVYRRQKKGSPVV